MIFLIRSKISIDQADLSYFALRLDPVGRDRDRLRNLSVVLRSLLDLSSFLDLRSVAKKIAKKIGEVGRNTGLIYIGAPRSYSLIWDKSLGPG